MVRNETVSIVRRIKREARKSPAKAAVLVGLFGLALYAWAPLVIDWTGLGEESSPKAARPEKEPRQVAEEDGIRTQSSEVTEVAGKRPSWRELKQWQEGSLWTEVVEVAAMRDPFRPAEGGVEPVGMEEVVEETPVSSPEQVVDSIALQLTGTIVGPRRRVALLDGQAYGEGDVIRVDQLGTTWELEIRRIEPNRVTIGWQSIEREVTAPKREPVGRIELVEHSG